jgi:hypothetical protein
MDSLRVAPSYLDIKLTREELKASSDSVLGLINDCLSASYTTYESMLKGLSIRSCDFENAVDAVNFCLSDCYQNDTSHSMVDTGYPDRFYFYKNLKDIKEL